MAALRVLPAILLLVCLSLTAAHAAGGLTAAGAWKIEPGTAEPSYAVTEPTRTNLNIDTVVLGCEEIGNDRALQLQLYLTDDGPLRPTYPHTEGLKDDPKVEISIDGQRFAASLLFADTYVVLADDQVGALPMLSARLVDAMQAGKTMTLHFDLLAERAGRPVIDGEAVVELASGGRQAIAALRHCTRQPDASRMVSAKRY